MGGRGPVVIALRSLVFNAAFYLWTTLMFVACIPLLLVPRQVLIAAGRVWLGGTMALRAVICGLRYEIRGLSNLPQGACIIASKHQSAWDTLIYLLIVERPSFVFKKELMWIPVFGWYLLRTGSLPIDRAGGAKSLRRLIAHAGRALDGGAKIVIFPEGTRVAPGEHLPHHPGTAALYTRLGAPVVPVALNSGLFWGRRSFLKTPGRIVLEFLPPIAPGLPRAEFTKELERRIETATDALIDNARSAE